MRALVDIPDEQLKKLDELARLEKRSRAALVREAVDDLLARRAAKPTEHAFGLWKDRAIDGLEFQERARSEW